MQLLELLHPVDERLDAWARDAKAILGRELRHTIERVSPEAVKPDVPPAV